MPIALRTVNYTEDRLVFNDFEEFTEYFMELDSLFEFDQEVFDSIVNTTTPVLTVHEQFATDDAYSTFLSDPIMRAILNLNYEFQIGDALVTYLTDGQLLVLDASNATAKAAVRALDKGVAVDLEDIPEGAYWGTPKDLEDAIKIGCGCTLYIRPHGCDQMRVSGRCNSFFGGSGEGDLWVTFDPDGPGNPVMVLEEEVDGNFEFFISTAFDPMYENEGLFTATVDPACVLAGNNTEVYNYVPEEFASCDELHRRTEDLVSVGNERMFIEVSYYENWLAYYHKAEIRSLTWNGSSWAKSKANLWVEVDANRRSVGCDLLDSKDDDKSCSNCRSRTVRVSWLSYCAHCDGDLIGRFRKIRSGTTLNQTLDVDFDCCM